MMVNAINKKQSSIDKLTKELGSGKNTLSPTDRSIVDNKTTEIRINNAYMQNQKTAENKINISLNVTSYINDSLSHLNNFFIQSSSDRSVLLEGIKGELTNIVDMLNTTDSNGTYLFSGAQSFTKPYTLNAGVFQYNGDTIDQNIMIGKDNLVKVRVNGTELLNPADNPIQKAYDFIAKYENNNDPIDNNDLQDMIQSINGAKQSVTNSEIKLSVNMRRIDSTYNLTRDLNEINQKSVDQIENINQTETYLKLSKEINHLMLIQQVFGEANKAWGQGIMRLLG